MLGAKNFAAMAELWGFVDPPENFADDSPVAVFFQDDWGKIAVFRVQHLDALNK